MKLGRFADKDPVAETEAAAKEQQEKAETEAVPIGARCEVTLAGSSMAKRGTVMFAGRSHHIYGLLLKAQTIFYSLVLSIGKTDKSSYFVGVKYDEPLGKNDGR